MSLKDQIEAHGPRIANYLEQAAIDYGVDAVRWAIGKFEARREARVDAEAEAAKARMHEAAEERKAELAAEADEITRPG